MDAKLEKRFRAVVRQWLQQCEMLKANTKTLKCPDCGGEHVVIVDVENP